MSIIRRSLFQTLLVLLAIATFELLWVTRPASAADPAIAAAKIIVSVPGIPGPYCAYGVEKRLKELPGVLRVRTHWQREVIHADLASGARITRAQVLAIMKTADYPYDYAVEIK